MVSEDYIKVFEQFELASEPGYLVCHIKLTKALTALGGRPDRIEKPERTKMDEERKKDEMFEQACENIARHVLLAEEDICQLPVQAARQMILSEYKEILDNPRRGDASRAAAVH